jgi:hypothetical protein
MKLIDVATIIGDVLTQIDRTLQNPDLPDVNWQTLYALRKHLVDLQRDLIGKTIKEDDADYTKITIQLNAASAELKDVISDLTKVDKIINIVSQVANYADKILDKLA